jgi:DnaK suppressor protein
MKEYESYCPSDDEEYMNDNQLNYFENRLIQLKQELIAASRSAKNDLKESHMKAPDTCDVATHHTEFAIGLKDMERTQRKLTLIEKALTRIDRGEYGYCDLTGEEIGLKRLQVHPAATYSIEGQEMIEQRMRINGQSRGPHAAS